MDKREENIIDKHEENMKRIKNTLDEVVKKNNITDGHFEAELGTDPNDPKIETLKINWIPNETEIVEK